MQDNSPLIARISHAVKELNLSNQEAFDILRGEEGALYECIIEICQLIDSNIEAFCVEVSWDTSAFEGHTALVEIALYALEQIEHVASAEALVYLFKVTGAVQTSLFRKYQSGDQVVDALIQGMCSSEERVARGSYYALFAIKRRGGVAKSYGEKINSLLNKMHPSVQPTMRMIQSEPGINFGAMLAEEATE